MLHTVWKHNECGIRLRITEVLQPKAGEVAESFSAEMTLPTMPICKCKMSLEEIKAHFTLEAPSLHYKELPDEKS